MTDNDKLSDASNRDCSSSRQTLFSLFPSDQNKRLAQEETEQTEKSAKVWLFLRPVVLLLSLFACDFSTAFAQGKEELDQLPMRRVFVPVDDLDALIARDQRGVLLPKDEFLKLYRDAQKNAPSDKSAPVGAIVSGATYSARFDGEQLLVTAEIKLSQFHDTWLAIALPLAGMSVEQAKLNGEAAKLGRADQNLFLLSEAKGNHVLTLELSAPLNAVGADKLASLGVLPGVAATLKVAVPAGKHLHFDELSVEHPSAADQPANYELAVGGQRNTVTLQLTDRQRERATDSLLFATTGFGLRVAPGEVTWHAVTTLQVHGTPLDRLVCVVPKTLEITDVDSNGLEAWELSDNPDDATTTRITLNYRQSFDGARRIDFRGVMAVPAGEAWQVPTLRINQVTSHIGRALIQHAPAVRLRTVESNGVRTATVSDADLKQIGTAGATDAGQVSLLFDVWQEKFTLGFVAQPKEQTVQASIASIFDLNSHGLDLITAATVETSFAPLFEIELTLPAEWLITQVTVNGQPQRWEVTPRDPGTTHVRIPLPQPLKPGVEAKLQINAHRDPDEWPVEDEPVEVSLPELRLPQSSVTEGTYVIKADADLEVVPVELTGLDAANVAVPGTRLGFAYQDSKFSGMLKVDRKPSRVSARTLTFARVDKQTLHTHFESELEITGGGLRVLEVALPESAGKDLRFQMVNAGGRIVEQTSRAGENGELIWTLCLDRHLAGTATLVVTSVAPRAGEREKGRKGDGEKDQTTSNVPLPISSSPPLPLSHLRVLAADRQHGYIAIEAEGDQRLNVTATDANKSNLPDVDPIDLPAPAAYVPTQRIVSAFRYFTGTPSLTIADERFDRLPVPTAICREAKITSILSAAGEFQHEASFQFTAVGVQSLQIRLPEGTDGKNNLKASLWAALVDGQPVEVRHAGGAFLIPLPPSDDPVGERSLQLFYRTLVPALRGTGELRQPPPELTVLNGAGVSQPMQVLDQQWELRYPQDLLLTDSKGAFVPDSPLRSSNWLTRLPQKLTLPSWYSAGRMIGAMMFVVILLAFIWLGFRWSWIGSCCLSLLLVGFVGFFLTFGEQEQQNATLFAQAAREGRVFGLNDIGDKVSGAPMTDLRGDTSAMFDAPKAGGAPASTAPATAPMSGKPSEEAFERKEMVVPQAAVPKVEVDFAKPTDRKIKIVTGGGTSKKDMELGRLVKNFNDLMDQKRYAEAEVIAKQAKDLDSDNPVTETLIYKSQLARRMTSNDRLKAAKEEGFWTALDSVEESGVPSDDRKSARGRKEKVEQRFVGIAERGKRSEGQEFDQTRESVDLEHIPFPNRDAGGLLSLTMALEGQADAAVKKFRYLGTETAGSGIGLEVVYENRAAGWTGRWLWMAALAFVAWLIPLAARNARVYWSILGLTLPLALAPLVPMPWQNALDGIFFGTLAAITLWTSRCLCDSFCCALPQMKSKAFWTRSLSQQAEVVKGG